MGTMILCMILLLAGLIIGLFNTWGKRYYAIVVLLVMTLLFSFRIPQESDTEAYFSLFESLKTLSPNQLLVSYGVDYAFLVLMRCAAILGLPFEAFRAALFLVSMLLMVSTIRKLTDNYALFFCVYFVFPFGYDIDQIRQLFATAIVVYALRFLMFSDRNIIKYIICILLASFFHLSAIVFMLYLLIGVRNDKLYIVCSIGGAVLFWISLLTSWDWVGILGRFLRIDKIYRYSRSMTEYKMGPLFGCFEFLFAYSFLFIIELLYLQRNQKLITLENVEDYFTGIEVETSIKKLCCISMVAMPFIAYSLTFERILRPMIIVSYALICGRIQKRTTTNKAIIVTILAVMLCLRSSITFLYTSKIFTNCTLF